ncbi:MAG: SGNH/GDSL hydrolase family protein [archaeon]
MIGDSFILGDGAENNLSLADSAVSLVMQGKLDRIFGSGRYEILNFGLKGVNTLDELFILKEFVLKYNPDLVILAVSGNDWYFQDYNPDPYVYCDVESSFSGRIIHSLSRTSVVFNYFDKRLRKDRMSSSDEEGIFNRKCFNISISRIGSTLSNEKILSFAPYIFDSYNPDPNPENIFKDLESEEDVNSEIDFVHSCLESVGFIYVDTYPFIMNLTNREVFADDQYHFSRKVNYLIADIILNHILDRRLIPGCQSIDCESKKATLSHE